MTDKYFMNLSYTDKVTIKVILMSIISIFGLFYFFYAGGTIWQLILIRFVARFFMAAHAIGSHRWLCHYSFKPSLFGKYLMLTGLVMTGYGRPLHLAVAHGMHHKYTDQPLDPHSPRDTSFLSLWLGRYNLHDNYVVPMKFFREKEAMFVNQNYWALFFLFNIALMIIDLKTALVFGPLNFIYSWTLNAVINYYGHKQGDQIGPKNLNKLISIFTVGEGLHKTHHDNPSSYDFGSKGQPDLGKIFIELFLINRSGAG